MKRYLTSLYAWIIFAVIIGGLIGYFFPTLGTSLKPLGDGFIKLIKVFIAPIIFCTIALGFAKTTDAKKLGRLGAKSLIYFEVLSTIALIFGLVVVDILRPGAGMNVNVKTLDTSAIQNYVQQAQHLSITDFILHIIPDSFIGAFANNDLLQVLVVAIFFGIALQVVGSKMGRHKIHNVVQLLEDTSEAFFMIINFVMKVAPIGALGAMAYTIGAFGTKSIVHLAALIGSFYLASALFIVVILGLVAYMAGFSIFKWLRITVDEIIIVAGASSSEAALPSLLKKLGRLGLKKETVGFVVPAGYSFNLDGTNIYMTMATMFVAQAIGADITLGEEIFILVIAMLTSKGASGISGSGFITLTATLMVVGDKIPVAGMALILGIDRFMSEARAITNNIGNGVAAIVMSRWEGEISKQELRENMDRIIEERKHHHIKKAS